MYRVSCHTTSYGYQNIPGTPSHYTMHADDFVIVEI